MFEVKCTDCGKITSVPFRPTEGKPVYCRPCLSKHMPSRVESRNLDFGFDPKQAWARRGSGNGARKEPEPTSIYKRQY